MCRQRRLPNPFFHRIDAVEERVHSYIRLMKEEAIAAAAKADEDIKKGDIKPLTGIPIALKDIVCTKGITTTCGSHILHNFVPPYNATVVEKLRRRRSRVCRQGQHG